MSYRVITGERYGLSASGNRPRQQDRCCNEYSVHGAPPRSAGRTPESGVLLWAIADKPQRFMSYDASLTDQRGLGQPHFSVRVEAPSGLNPPPCTGVCGGVPPETAVFYNLALITDTLGCRCSRLSPPIARRPR